VLPRVFHVVDLEAEVVQALVARCTFRVGRIVVLEFEDGQVDVAIGQKVAGGEVRIRHPNLLQTEGLLEKGGNLVRVLGRNGDMPDFGCHTALL
jgi:hypothetical protein